MTADGSDTHALEHLDVLIIGAGLSGIAAAHYVTTDCPWASFALFEARGAIGGTWDLFRYPGIRSDSDMFTLGYPFRPWNGKKSIADGPSILQYIRDTAREEGIDGHIRFHHRIVAVDWSTDDGRWKVTAQRTDTGDTVHLTCGFLVSCSGYYRYDHGYTPDFAGADRFQGTIVHPQHWPEDLDYVGKRVVVIGSGATAITLIPSMAKTAGHVTMLQRSPSYVASLPSANPIAYNLQRILPGKRTGQVIRWLSALSTQAFYEICTRRPTLMKKVLRRGLERQLPEDFDIDTHFTPRYDPWDQRLCVVADGDLFKAIRNGTASIVTDRIDRFTERGILLQSGRELEADIIVTATGLEMLFIGGIDVTIDATPVDLPSKLTYKGMMLEGVPNLAIAFGYTNNSWTLKADLTCRYVARLLNHLRETGTTVCTPVNRGTPASTEPLLGLSSGYVQRAADQFPRQGAADPWRTHQSYVRDFRNLSREPVDDGTMRFSRPTRPATTPPRPIPALTTN